MSTAPPLFLASVITLFAPIAQAANADFSGVWSVDTKTTEQRARKAECGEASFALKQVGITITGSHAMATADCGRLNEGGENTVKGYVTGKQAKLTITSGRNGAVVKGVASMKGDKLHWRTIKEVKAGDPANDSPLILHRGVLTRGQK